MKARLVKYYDEYHLLLSSGKIEILDLDGAIEFFKTYDSPEHYEGEGEWPTEITPMEKYNGNTVFIVEDDGRLVISDTDFFHSSFEVKEFPYLTPLEYAEKHGRKRGIIMRFCRDGRIDGVVQKEGKWYIPKNAPYPNDERFSTTATKSER